MIVVDTNIIAYLWLPGERTKSVEALFRRDPYWIAPFLWRSELRNVLLGYVRKRMLEIEDAIEIQEAAEQQMRDREYIANSTSVLSLAASSKVSAYDCEFVALATELGVPLVTTDKAILREFPGISRSI